MTDAPSPGPVRWIERLRDGAAPLVLYPLLALVSFPTLALLLFGRDGGVYAHDILDLARSGVGADWLEHGPTLWNTHVGGGNALLAQQAIGPLAIDVPLAFFVGPFGAFAVWSWLLPAFAGIAMHLLLRDVLRLSTFAVVGGALLYQFVFWHPIYGFSAPAVPLLLWLLEGLIRPGRTRWRYVVGRVACGAFALHDGQAQIVALIVGFELVYLVLVHRGDGATMRRGLAAWAGTWALAFALYGPVLLTQVVALPLSQRSIWDVADVGLVDGISTILRRYSPAILGVPIGGGWGSSPAVYGTYFLGALGLPMLALGLVRRTGGRRVAVIASLIVAIPVIDLLASIATPHLDDFGFLKSFQVVRVRHMLPFAMIVTAAMGLEAVHAAVSHGAPLVVGRLRRLVVALSVVPLLAAFVFAGLQLVRGRRRLLELDQAALGWLATVGALALGLAASVALVAWLWRRASGSRLTTAGTLITALLLVIAIERPLYAQAERLTGRSIASWNEERALTPGQAFLLAQPQIGVERVLTFGDDANRMGGAGLLHADGYQAIYPRAYHRLFGALIAPQLAVDAEDWTYFHHWGNRAITFGPRVDPELVALLGIRWLYVRGSDAPTVPGLVPRFRGRRVTVYEVPTTLPRAFVTDRVELQPDDDALTEALAAATLDELGRTAYAAAGAGADALQAAVGTSPNQPGAAGTGARIAAYTPDRVVIEVDTTRRGVLILTDVWAPGWVAEVDGVEAPIARVDLAFRGVPVGPDSRQVVFRYVPVFTYAGFGLALAGLVGTILVAAVVRRRDRRP